MKTFILLEEIKFHDQRPNAEPLHVAQNGRALLFTLKSGQSINEHEVPSSPFFVVIIQGQGVFTGKDGAKQTVGPDTLLVFDPQEKHSVQAIEDLAFVGFLHGAPGWQKEK